MEYCFQLITNSQLFLSKQSRGYVTAHHQCACNNTLRITEIKSTIHPLRSEQQRSPRNFRRYNYQVVLLSCCANCPVGHYVELRFIIQPHVRSVLLTSALRDELPTSRSRLHVQLYAGHYTKLFQVQKTLRYFAACNRANATISQLWPALDGSGNCSFVFFFGSRVQRGGRLVAREPFERILLMSTCSLEIGLMISSGPGSRPNIEFGYLSVCTFHVTGFLQTMSSHPDSPVQLRASRYTHSYQTP